MDTPKKTAILFLVQYPEKVSPGQRFRFELYEQLLSEQGYCITTEPFLDSYGYNIIFKRGFFFRKFYSVIVGFFRRARLLFTVKKYSFILLQIGVAPIGPPAFEWILAKVLRKKIIYDFDGAIWIEGFSEKNKLPKFLKSSKKVCKICAWSYKVSCGNNYLVEFAQHYNKKVFYNPTCVDTENHHNILANHNVDKVTIGWTGSFSTLQYLYLLTPVLRKLQEKYNFCIKIICNEAPELDLQNVEYISWSIEKEVTELAKCQIGLMPLPDNEWSKGKCGFKLIQYLALEIPAVSSAVGVNKEIIEEGINGFLCDTDNDWYHAIEKLIINQDLRKSMGKKGRNKIIEKYSLESNSKNFLSLFS